MLYSCYHLYATVLCVASPTVYATALPHAVQLLMLYSCCHCVCQCSVLPRYVKLHAVAAIVYTTVLCVAACCTVEQLLPFCIPVFCVATCHTVCRTVAATMYATVLCVTACRKLLHIVQLLPFCMPVLCVAVCREVTHVVQLMPFCMPVFCVSMCRTVAHVVHYVCHGVMCCRMPCSCFMLYS